jgi:hypothetical protein
LKAVILGRDIAADDLPFALEKATGVRSRLPSALFASAVFAVMVASNAESLFPLTPLDAVLLAIVGACLLTYVMCMAAALRIWWRLGRGGQPPHGVR